MWYAFAEVQWFGQPTNQCYTSYLHYTRDAKRQMGWKEKRFWASGKDRRRSGSNIEDVTDFIKILFSSRFIYSECLDLEPITWASTKQQQAQQAVVPCSSPHWRHSPAYHWTVRGYRASSNLYCAYEKSKGNNKIWESKSAWTVTHGTDSSFYLLLPLLKKHHGQIIKQEDNRDEEISI